MNRRQQRSLQNGSSYGTEDISRIINLFKQNKKDVTLLFSSCKENRKDRVAFPQTGSHGEPIKRSAAMINYLD